MRASGTQSIEVENIAQSSRKHLIHVLSLGQTAKLQPGLKVSSFRTWGVWEGSNFYSRRRANQAITEANQAITEKLRRAGIDCARNRHCPIGAVKYEAQPFLQATAVSGDAFLFHRGYWRVRTTVARGGRSRIGGYAALSAKAVGAVSTSSLSRSARRGGRIYFPQITLAQMNGQ